MRRGRSMGGKTEAQQARLDAIKDIGCIARRRAYVTLDDVRAEFWNMTGQNRRVG